MRTILMILMAVALASPAAAQTGACPTSTALVTNPTWVCLVASPDHNVIELGVAKLTSYNLLFFAPGVDSSTGAPTQTIPIGKPTPNAQNAIWLQRAELAAIPIGQQYVARATAAGPSGTSARSSESNPFGRTSNQPPAAPPSVVVRD